MKTWCLIDKSTGKVFKVVLSKELLQEYLENHPQVTECVNCVECDDAPSITLE